MTQPYNPFSDEAPEEFEPASPPSSIPTGSIDFQSELNEEQLAAVTSPPGPSLVLAGAGSGKTRTLTYRVAWLLEQGVQPHQILLLTFTNKAAREMLERVEDLTGIPANKFWGGTFHHIGQKVLRRFGSAVGLSSGFTIMDEGDAEGLLQQVIKDLNPAFLKSKDNPKARVIHNLISFQRNTRLPMDEVVNMKAGEYDNLTDDFIHFAEHYQKAKLERQVTDYDDLLEAWLVLLEKQPELSEYFGNRFRHLLVDEYQDTNSLQSDIIDRMAPHHHIMAVGDDAQCIYTWRGADFENIMSFPERHPDTVIYKIETNYRSTPNILEFANNVLQAQPTDRGYSKELRASRPQNQDPIVVKVLDTRQQAEFVIKRMMYLFNEGVSPGDVAVLYRAHYQSMDLQMELTRQGVPFQITSGLRFFEQAHVKDLAAMLRFVSNPEDTTAFHRFVGLLPKVGPKTCEKLLLLLKKTSIKNKESIFETAISPAIREKVPADARKDWTSLSANLLQMRQALEEDQRPMDVVAIAVDGWYSDYLRRTYANSNNREDDLHTLTGFSQRFDDMTELLSQLVLMSSETSQNKVATGEDQVRLTTIHQAKGLEFSVVFIIGLSDGLFPLKRAIEEGNIEEERRLFYVGVTRAMNELYLLSPKITGGHGPMQIMPPSRFVSEVDPAKYTSHSMYKSYSNY